ncbi:hypothetical protein GCM10019059_42460 [Camelimonas fluminis]|uniref:Uncharacterized protein n=1 Tax=Camelimonas fluminis TaxID=1576911 RepID=A0ABV7UNS6_9HYPH|nr:hypothetical protein [Camelimonas fluminis]GHE79436.1 hypothetical protein GCM10019059_42460 [Camelimonas fluminis]
MPLKPTLAVAIAILGFCLAAPANAEEVKKTPRCKSWEQKLSSLEGEASRLGSEVSCRNLKRLASIADDASKFFNQCVDGGEEKAGAYRQLANTARAQIRDSYAGGC